MAGLPPNLTYFMSRLQGVSTSHFKIYPQNTGSQSANRIIRFELASNTLLNLKSTRILFNVSATTANAQAARLPNDTRSFIDRMAIYMGGVLVQNSFSNYNVLVHAQKALGADRCTDTTLTHQEIVRSKSYHNGATLTEKEEYTTPDVQLAITDFLGFLQADPSIIDTGLFPQITIEITLADNVICPSILLANVDDLATTSKTGGLCATSTAGSTYSITDMTMQVEVLGMASSILDEVVAQRISQVGYLSIPFPNYFSFSSTHNTTSRFNINSSCWNKLWVAWRDPANATAQAPQVVAGHKIAGAFVSSETGTVPLRAANGTGLAQTADIVIGQDMGKPQYDIGGTYNTNSERYIARFFNFEERNAAPTTSPTTFQLQINSANYPAYKLTVPEVYALTMNSIDIYDKNRMMSLDQYRKNFFVQCYRFDLPESSYSRNLSGLDSRSSSSQCAMVTENMTADTTCFMFCECTSELRVANRAIEVIV
jgi:hypothetical protein